MIVNGVIANPAVTAEHDARDQQADPGYPLDHCGRPWARTRKDTDQQPADQERAHHGTDDREHRKEGTLVLAPVRDRRRVRQVDVGWITQPIGAVG